MSLTELEARRALVEEEPEEFAGMSLTDLEAEYGRRADQLEQCRAQCLPAQVRIVGNRLEALRAEIEQRGRR